MDFQRERTFLKDFFCDKKIKAVYLPTSFYIEDAQEKLTRFRIKFMRRFWGEMKLLSIIFILPFS